MRQSATIFLAIILMILASHAPVLASGPAHQSSGGEGLDTQFPQRQQEPQPDPELEKKMAKARLEERYKNLKRDSEKLLELATELKQYVDKSNQNVLSMEVINKCDQIEKLAKSVRTKMKGE